MRTSINSDELAYDNRALEDMMNRRKVILRPVIKPQAKWVILIPEKGNPNICEMLEFERYIDAARYFIDNNMYEKYATIVTYQHNFSKEG